MTVPRLYVESALVPGTELDLPVEPAHHVRAVLRLARGAAVTLFNGRGGEYPAEIVALTREVVRTRLGERQPGLADSPLIVTLVQAVSRGERMDYTLQKAVELGVARIVPVLSKRSVVKLDAERAAARMAHWRGVVRHAAEQCGRCSVPQVATVLRLAEWIEANAHGVRYLLSPFAAHGLAELPAPLGPLALVAGPEGGFAPEEVVALRAAGAESVRLGPRILRTETAAVVALAVMQARWGDLR